MDGGQGVSKSLATEFGAALLLLVVFNRICRLL